MEWTDNKKTIIIHPPKEFSFEECLVFLGRSNQEMTHQIKDGYLYKLMKLNGKRILLKISGQSREITIDFPLGPLLKNERMLIAKYVWDWFDLERDLCSFYDIAYQDEILRPIVQKYDGLRMIGISNLFEALTWAIIGQQINLPFAYALKKRFIEQFGEPLEFEGQTFWLYPTPEKIAALSVEDLRNLQFSVRKAEYVIEVASKVANGTLTKVDLLQNENDDEIKKTLMNIRGIGEWTAHYVMMKCLHSSSAFPITDVGLHNALKQALGLHRKPSLPEIKGMSKKWDGWEAYATIYLWRSLYD
ncbi:DNA-3-methyladenine glycosylase 2 [Bacillus spongiae]|uniref:DNA-3-methyladenine glycosylase II n=1 Tax=Bacillus spongiae TaxID=2683610 RepID=A0ABU8HF34_9BACI